MLALANGVRQSVTLEATNFKHYSVTVPDGSLPLELSLTKLNGEAALYVSPTETSPDSTSKMWALERNGGDTLTIDAIPYLLKENVECQSNDVLLGAAGTFADAPACATACANKDGCRYFIFGK